MGKYANFVRCKQLESQHLQLHDCLRNTSWVVAIDWATSTIYGGRQRMVSLHGLVIELVLSAAVAHYKHYCYSYKLDVLYN